MAIAAGGVTAAVDDVPAPSLEPPPPPPQPTPAAPAPARLTETALERRMEAAIAQLRQIVADGKELLAPASSEAERLSVQETVVLELEKTLAPARAALAAARAGVGLLEPTRGYFVAPGALKGNSLERLKPGIESGSWQSRPIGVDPRAVAPSDADAAAAAAVAAAERAAAAAAEEEDSPRRPPSFRLTPSDRTPARSGGARRRLRLRWLRRQEGRPLPPDRPQRRLRRLRRRVFRSRRKRRTPERERPSRPPPRPSRPRCHASGRRRSPPLMQARAKRRRPGSPRWRGKEGALNRLQLPQQCKSRAPHGPRASGG